jgi:hypothetical protein
MNPEIVYDIAYVWPYFDRRILCVPPAAVTPGRR